MLNMYSYRCNLSALLYFLCWQLFSTRDRHNMLLIFPIILCSNSRRYHLLCFAFLPVMLESMIDINVKNRLETISQCHCLLYVALFCCCSLNELFSSENTLQLLRKVVTFLATDDHCGKSCSCRLHHSTV